MGNLNDEIIAEFISLYGNNFSSTEERDRKMRLFMMQRYNTKRENFEGYTAIEMSDILSQTFSTGKIVQLKECSSDVYNECPLFRQIKHVISVLLRDGKIKLTTKGALPVKLVKELYPLGASEPMVEIGFDKVNKEADTIATLLTHFVMKLMKIVKEEHGVMTIIKEREKMVEDDHALMKSMLHAMTHLVDYACFDNMKEYLGAIGMSYSIVLLHKYGDKKRYSTFYSTKYFKALFPEEKDHRVYWIRVFDRYLRQLGFITYESHMFGEPPYIQKTDLFDKLITVTAPKGKR